MTSAIRLCLAVLIAASSLSVVVGQEKAPAEDVKAESGDASKGEAKKEEIPRKQDVLAGLIHRELAAEEPKNELIALSIQINGANGFSPFFFLLTLSGFLGGGGIRLRDLRHLLRCLYYYQGKTVEFNCHNNPRSD